MKTGEYTSLGINFIKLLEGLHGSYSDEMIANMFHQVESRVLFEKNIKNPSLVFETIIQDQEYCDKDYIGKKKILAITNLDGTAFASMKFDPAYSPVRKDPVKGYVRDFVVKEESRQKGIGSQMIQALEAKARDLGVHILFIDSDLTFIPESWTGKWIARMGYRSDSPNDPRPFHYVAIHKRLIDSY